MKRHVYIKVSIIVEFGLNYNDIQENAQQNKQSEEHEKNNGKKKK